MQPWKNWENLDILFRERGERAQQEPLPTFTTSTDEVISISP
jgi:hypothetical protein